MTGRNEGPLTRNPRQSIRCPRCGDVEVFRERRPNGNSKCETGHVFATSAGIFAVSRDEALHEILCRRTDAEAASQKAAYEDYQYRKDEDGYDVGCDRCGTSKCMTAPFETSPTMGGGRENDEVLMIDGKPYQFYCPFCAETTAIGSVLEYKSLYNGAATTKEVARGLAQGFNLLYRLLSEKKE